MKEGGQVLLGGLHVKVHRNFFGSQGSYSYRFLQAEYLIAKLTLNTNGSEDGLQAPFCPASQYVQQLPRNCSEVSLPAILLLPSEKQSKIDSFECTLPAAAALGRFHNLEAEVNAFPYPSEETQDEFPIHSFSTE
eukprot:484048-Pyramimonas_sp.AAC.2